MDEVKTAEVRVVLGTESKVQTPQQVGRKYIVKCPKCGAENEVRL